MKYEAPLKELISNDATLMAMLTAVESLHLNDSWICAGIIRSKVWDSIQQCTTRVQDIDVIYYDPTETSIEKEKMLEDRLKSLLPGFPWSVKNQARMHKKNNLPPFRSSYEGVALFPETPTAVAVRIQDGELFIMAPYGLNDLFEMIVRPTPNYQAQEPLSYVYKKRMLEKQWEKSWPTITIER